MDVNSQVKVVVLVLVLLGSLAVFEIGGNQVTGLQTGTPDLQILGIGFTSEKVEGHAGAGRLVIINATVFTTGASVGTFKNTWFIDGNEVDAAYIQSHKEVISLFNETVESLGIGRAVSVKLVWRGISGAHTFKIKVDANDQVTESNEDNNELERTLRVNSFGAGYGWEFSPFDNPELGLTIANPGLGLKAIGVTEGMLNQNLQDLMKNPWSLSYILGEGHEITITVTGPYDEIVKDFAVTLNSYDRDALTAAFTVKGEGIDGIDGNGQDISFNIREQYNWKRTLEDGSVFHLKGFAEAGGNFGINVDNRCELLQLSTANDWPYAFTLDPDKGWDILQKDKAFEVEDLGKGVLIHPNSWNCRLKVLDPQFDLSPAALNHNIKTLKAGWTLISVTPSMVGRDISNLRGTCNIRDLWSIVPNRVDTSTFGPLWENLLGRAIHHKFHPREEGLGMFIQVANDCTLNLP